MPAIDLLDWLSEHDTQDYVWYLKRLSGNDTLANESHQAGPYIPKQLAFELCPELNSTEIRNPDTRFDLRIDSHGDLKCVRLIYYNNKWTDGKTRDETRITNLGGRASALLDPASTGALVVFAFRKRSAALAIECHVWVADSTLLEDQIEDLVGPIEPGEYSIRYPSRGQMHRAGVGSTQSCRLTADAIPSQWMRRFPSGMEIIRKTMELRPDHGMDPDERIVRRRDCEFEVFRSIEEYFYTERIRAGFESIEEFLVMAQTLLQSRKSRAGNSLELHARMILEEEGLRPNIDFHHKPITDGTKRPDFVFPSQRAYEDPGFPSGRLRLLAVKTTCRDRWRQVLNEADRIRPKHLLTVQEGISPAQFKEMQEAGVQLVVPGSLHSLYPASVRPHLLTLESFIADIRILQF